jgi:uncharacterized protein
VNTPHAPVLAGKDRDPAPEGKGGPDLAGWITHFEIYGDDPAQLAAFYRDLFGWKIERADAVDYWRINPDPPARAVAGGGIAYRPKLNVRGWLQYINVKSLDESLALAQRLGANVLKPKTAVPRTAWYAVLSDPEGNAFAIWQPDATAFPPPEPD